MEFTVKERLYVARKQAVVQRQLADAEHRRELRIIAGLLRRCYRDPTDAKAFRQACRQIKTLAGRDHEVFGLGARTVAAFMLQHADESLRDLPFVQGPEAPDIYKHLLERLARGRDSMLKDILAGCQEWRHRTLVPYLLNHKGVNPKVNRVVALMASVLRGVDEAGLVALIASNGNRSTTGAEAKAHRHGVYRWGSVPNGV